MKFTAKFSSALSDTFLVKARLHEDSLRAASASSKRGSPVSTAVLSTYSLTEIAAT
jgi:hypothetical protein